jgi:hypothetical protein
MILLLQKLVVDQTSIHVIQTVMVNTNNNDKHSRNTRLSKHGRCKEKKVLPAWGAETYANIIASFTFFKFVSI